MKNTGLKFGLVALGLTLAAGAQAVDGTLTLQGGWGPSGGGEFSVTSSTGLGAFKTFCLEYNEHINIPGTYDYTINSKAVGGGPGYTPNGDPLSIGTAWLYSQFRAGGLTTGLNVYDTANDQDNLQKAIWWLEEETAGANNEWVTAAKVALGTPGNPLTDAQVRAAANGAFGVVALNLSVPGNDRLQDVLGLPDGGLTLGMLGTGMVALGLARRRVAAKA